MHGATADAPPQVFTFPRRPPNAESAKGGENGRESERESSSDNCDSSADERATPSSSSTANSSSSDTSLAAVSGSHAGSDRAVSWSAKDAASG